MVEVVGDSSRDGRWALVRLALEGDRILSAEAEGLERPLEGLTLLEAAAVGGEELAVDALANAIGPVFRAEPKESRVAVAMSGGVDSAVALLRAGPDAIGVTLRLWLDPGPERSAPAAHPRRFWRREPPAMRWACRVTLDLREEFRRAVVPAVRPRLRARRDPNP
jgi:tRNA-specific 2-thiouridylase